ncbi:MAG: glutathione S-transferase family protein [Pseudomonadota bacterium]
MSEPQITLYTLGDAFGMQNVSPFCFKAELLLTHLQLPFDLQVEKDPRKAPKGKMPYAIINGEQIADSELICRRLDELTQGRVYGGLTPAQAAYGLSLTRLAEEHLYWILVASRWLDDDWWPNVVDGFFGIVPAPFRGLAARGARKSMRQTYDLQGLGRHTLAEQEAFARSDLQALQDAVGDGPFLFGETPCVHDFAVAAILSGIYYNQPATWLTRLAGAYPALPAYVARVESTVGAYAGAPPA